MPGWIKNAVMITVCVVWAGVVIGSVIHGEIPGAFVWAVPGGTYAAITGGAGLRRRIRVEIDEGNEDPPKPPLASGGGQP
jgi:hypothetical protein